MRNIADPGLSLKYAQNNTSTMILMIALKKGEIRFFNLAKTSAAKLKFAPDDRWLSVSLSRSGPML